MQELWLPIQSSPGYEVSSMGRLRSVDRSLSKRCRWGSNINYIRKGKILNSTYVNGAGYQKCQLGASKTVMVHRVVADAFCPRNECKKIVNHKNGNKLDNRAENLEWVTNRENVIHSRISLRGRGKTFTIDQVINIIRRASSGERVTDLAKEYTVSRQCISNILSGRMWPSDDYPEIGTARAKYPYISPKFGTKWMITSQPLF